MIDIVIFTLFWFVLAFAFAALEVEIEGKHGWAEKLPTWSRTEGPVPKLFAFFAGGNPLTGYHLFLSILVLMIFHIGFIQGLPWSLGAELRILAVFFAWVIIWDFLWFVLNPAYGLINFRRENIWWHSNDPWLFDRIPVTYTYSLLTSLFISVISALVIGDAGVFVYHLEFLAIFFALTGVTIFLSPLYHKWYLSMHQNEKK